MGSFDDFYTETAQDTLLVIYAMCGDRKLAQESVQEAFEQLSNEWEKVPADNRARYVREHAWHLLGLNRTQHPLRRSDESGSDTELLNALLQLPTDSRRLLVLLTIGGLDLDQAAPEIQVTTEVGMEMITEALNALETALGQDIASIETRLLGLALVTKTMDVPPGEEIRQRARSSRLRNSVASVLAVALGLLGMGVAVAANDPFELNANLPQRQQFGNEGADQVLLANRFDESQLLTPEQLASLSPNTSWEVTATEVDVDGDIPYATCPTKRFADEDPLRTFVRTFDGTGEVTNRLAQAVEISRSKEAAGKAFATTVSWFAECQHPRVQLTEAYVVERPTGDFTILRLQSHRDGLRTFTVGISQSGMFSLTIVNETEGGEGPDIEAFAQVLNDSVYRLCTESGGECPRQFTIANAIPPAATSDPGFLGVVDLPPIADVDSIWAASEAKASTQSKSQTLCEAADWSKAVKGSLSSRVFVMPEAGLPDQFGVAQTVAKFSSEEKAIKWLADTEEEMDSCPRRVLSIDTEDVRRLSLGENEGSVFKLRLRLADEEGRIRTGFVRRGSAVSQITLTPVGKYDMNDTSFKQLVERAGQRLTYASQ